MHRLLDWVYLTFFAVHLSASLLVDGQAFYPSDLVPSALKAVLANYLRDSGDPLVANALQPQYAWFSVALILELVFQVPCFIVGIWGLWRDDKRVYPLLIAYGTLATVSTLQCLATVLYGKEATSLTDKNLRVLLQSYVPFTIVPLLLTADLTIRCTSLIGRAPLPKVQGDRKLR